MRSSALTRLMSFGPVVSTQILTTLRTAKDKDQRLYLESATDLLTPNDLNGLKRLEPLIKEDKEEATFVLLPHSEIPTQLKTPKSCR